MPRESFKMDQAMKAYNKNTAQQRNSNAYKNTTGSRLGFGGKIIKAAIITFNIILLIMSFALIIGAAANLNGNYVPLVNTWLIPVVILGVFLFIVAAMGGLCSMRESICWLWIYSGFLTIIGIAILATCSYALSFAGNENALMTETWIKAGPAARESIQTTYSCCGLAQYADKDAAFPCPRPGPENATIAKALNSTGDACMNFLVRDFKAAAGAFPIVGMAVFVLMVFVAFLVCCLVRSIAGSRSSATARGKENV